MGSLSTATSGLPFAFFAPPKKATAPKTDITLGDTGAQRKQLFHVQDSYDPQTLRKPLVVPPATPQEMKEMGNNSPQLASKRSKQLEFPFATVRGSVINGVDTTEEKKAVKQHEAEVAVEDIGTRLLMYHRLEKSLSPQGKKDLNTLLEKNVLNQTAGDDAHSTLYYLYAMSAGPKAPGWDSRLLGEDMVSILAHPYDIEQDNTPLLPAYKQMVYNTASEPTGDIHAAQVMPTERNPDDVDIIRTFNCSEAAELSRMASRNPKELTRHLYELTSPQETFYEKATPEEMYPDQPAMAYDELINRNMAYQRLPDGDLLVQVPASRSAVLRAQNTQQQMKTRGLKPKEASPLQALYEETLLYNGGRKNYDVATDKRDMLDIATSAVQETENLSSSQKAELQYLLANPKADEARNNFEQRFQQWKGSLTESETLRIEQAVWGENNGLTGDQKGFMERLVNDGKAFQLVQYHALFGPEHSTDENYDNLYLYGYYRDFKDIEGDLVKAVEAGEEPIVNESMFFEGGYTVAGHEIKLHGTSVDEKTGERYFQIVDTDDEQKGLKSVKAREFIPTVGHVTLPKEIANPIVEQMNAMNGQFLVPEPSDAKDFDLQPIAHMDDEKLVDDKATPINLRNKGTKPLNLTA